MQTMETTSRENFGGHEGVSEEPQGKAQGQEDPVEADARFFESLLRMPDQNRLTIGMQLAAKYYGNSAERYRSREEKHHSLSKLAKRLAERKVVHVSKSLLANCIAAHFQESELGLIKSNAELLSFAARVALLREKDPTRKIELARRAIDERLSVKELMAVLWSDVPRRINTPVSKLAALAQKIGKLAVVDLAVAADEVDDVRNTLGILEDAVATLKKVAKRLPKSS